MRLSILYQSDDYVVVNKPVDVLMNRINKDQGLSHVTDTRIYPCNNNADNGEKLGDHKEDDEVHTVESLLKLALPTLHDPSLCFGFRFVHRLDYSTSGVLCVALNKSAAAECQRVFQSRSTAKYYVALVNGHFIFDEHGINPTTPVFRVNVAVGSDSRPDHAHRMCVEGESYCSVKTLRPAITEVLVLQTGFYSDHHLGKCSNHGCLVAEGDEDDDCLPPKRRLATKFLLKAITGRRHQLRLHCCHLGHTIIGDYTYSDRTDTEPSRMFLHALRLVVPTRIETLDVSTDDPFDARDDTHSAKWHWTPTRTFHSLDDPHIYDYFDNKDKLV